MDAWSVLKGLWLFLPAYVANMSPVFTAKMIPKWDAPIDGGRIHRDGQRILGDGKTWRGLAGGALFGAATALLVAWLAWNDGPVAFFSDWDYGVAGSNSWWQVGLFGGIVGFLALVGDATESYFKRRSGRQRGAPWIPFDQLDFVAFGLLGMLVASPLLDGWIIDVLLTDWIAMATIILGTVVLHLLVNRIGYWIGLKEVPW